MSSTAPKPLLASTTAGLYVSMGLAVSVLKLHCNLLGERRLPERSIAIPFAGGDVEMFTWVDCTLLPAARPRGWSMRQFAKAEYTTSLQKRDWHLTVAAWQPQMRRLAASHPACAVVCGSRQTI